MSSGNNVGTSRCLQGHYIPAIDGLRALAVLAVMFYHFDAALLPGGFTGVDVFFVISGYVVSASLARQQDSGFFAFTLSFYARRIVRILPALIVCLLLVTLASTALIPQAWLSDSSDQTGLFAFFGLSNVMLVLLNDGYFAPRVEFNPFTHTWSLGVEEQFYLLFPLVFFAWLQLHHRRGWSGIGAKALLPTLLIGSLLFAWWATPRHPDWAFYLLPSRFWELAAGVLLFQLQQGGASTLDRGWQQSLLAGFGLGLILFAFGWSNTAAFPFPWALAAVVGTLLMIAVVTVPNQQATANASRPPVVQWLLEQPWLVHLGKISYSLYLWHWPIAVLMRWTSGLETWPQFLIALSLSVLFAEASFRWVEQPIRRNSWSRQQSAWKTVLVGFVTLGLAFSGARAIFDARPELSLSVTRDQRTWYPEPWPSTSMPGAQPWAGRQLFAIGDSHVGAYNTMLQQLSDEQGISLSFHFTGGCPVANLLNDFAAAGPDCAEQIEQHLRQIEAKARPGDLVLLASLRVHRFADQFAVFPFDQVLAIRDSAETQARREQALEEAFGLIQRLQAQGLEVIIDAPKPVFRSPAFRCSDWFNRHNPICQQGLSMEREQLLEHRAGAMDALRQLQQALPELHVWDPFPILCPSDPCSAFDGDKPLFFDADHLSAHGNRLLYPYFVAFIANRVDVRH
ncbi:MAG: acyltransferase [Chromatiaceae bacterium]|nr:acyltransferase [Chromatiaceae bacterium]